MAIFYAATSCQCPSPEQKRRNNNVCPPRDRKFIFITHRPRVEKKIVPIDVRRRKLHPTNGDALYCFSWEDASFFLGQHLNNLCSLPDFCDGNVSALWSQETTVSWQKIFVIRLLKFWPVGTRCVSTNWCWIKRLFSLHFLINCASSAYSINLCMSL